MYETSTSFNIYTGYNGLFYNLPNWFNFYHLEVEHRISKSMYLLGGNGFNRIYFHHAYFPMQFETDLSFIGIGAKPYEIKQVLHEFYFFAGLEKKFKSMGNFVFSIKSNFRLGFFSKSYLYSKYYQVGDFGLIDYGPYYYESKNFGNYANFSPDIFYFDLTPCLEYKRPKTSFYFQTSIILPIVINADVSRHSPYLCFQLGMRLFKYLKES